METNNDSSDNKINDASLISENDNSELNNDVNHKGIS